MEPLRVLADKFVTDSHKISQDSIRAVLNSTSSTPESLTRREEVMGGHGTITVVGANPEILNSCWDAVHQCERLWSRFKPDSEITQLNLAEGKPVSVSEQTYHLVSEMLHGYKLSAGTFNPTLLPEVIRAGYGSSVTNPQSQTLLPASAVSPGNMEQIVFGDKHITLPRGTVLDPGGIGKGVAADLVAARAMELGAWGVMVELGGDIVVQGAAPDGVAWRLGVENPFDTDHHSAMVRLSAGAIATSSQLKRRFGDQHHLINPQTKRSAVSDVQTVTAITGTGAMAEALTKAGFVLKPQEYLSWLPTVGAAGLIICADGSTLTSENWEKYQ